MADPLDLYPNLPGIVAQWQDGGLKIVTDPAPPSTQSIVLLGTAVDGPLMEPIGVDQSTVELVFGSATRTNGLPNGTTLVKGFEQAYQGGSRDIRLMRVTGSYATANITALSITTSESIAVDDQLGPAPGNIQTSFQLNNAGIVPSSVVVNANGVNLPSTAFTVNPGVQGATPVNGSVTVNAGVTDSNAAIYISYQYVDANGNTNTYSQNGYKDPATGAVTYFLAAGQDTILATSQQIAPGSLTVYSNGVAIASTGYSVGADDKSVVLNPGAVSMGSILEATYSTIETITEQPYITIQSVYAGSLYNGVSVGVTDIMNQMGQVVGILVTITKPAGKKAQVTEAPLTYSSLDYLSFQEMVNAINADTNNNVVVASAPNRFLDIDSSTLSVCPPTALTGGDDGLSQTKEQMFAALGGVRDSSGFLIQQGAYQLLENYTVDFVVPLGVYADDQLAGKYDNFAAQLALACAVMSFRNNTTNGVIATNSPDQAGLAAVNTLVQNLLANVQNNYYMRDLNGNILKDSNGNAIDLGRFISVVAGPDVVFNSQRLGVYAENSPAFYPGFVSTLAPQSAPTNKVVPANALRFTFSNKQLNDLTGARFITYTTKSNGQSIAVTDGMTAAQPTSDYRRLSTVRATKEAVDQVRIAADPYLGEPNDTAHNNAMSAAISKRLDALKSAGTIQDYSFVLVISAQDRLLGQGTIELTIVPPQELRRLTVVVSLTPALSS